MSVFLSVYVVERLVISKKTFKIADPFQGVQANFAERSIQSDIESGHVVDHPVLYLKLRISPLKKKQ